MNISTLPIVLLSLVLSVALYKRYRNEKRWEYYILMIAALLVFVSYFYITFFPVSFEDGRIIVRYVVIACLSLSAFVAIRWR